MARDAWEGAKVKGTVTSRGPVLVGDNEQEVFLGRELQRHREVSEKTAQLVDTEVSRVINGAYNRAKETLTQHLDLLDIVEARKCGDRARYEHPVDMEGDAALGAGLQAFETDAAQADRLHGIFIPVTTPFDAVTGEVAPISFRENLRRWVQEPIDGILLFDKPLDKEEWGGSRAADPNGRRADNPQYTHRARGLPRAVASPSTDPEVPS